MAKTKIKKEEIQNASEEKVITTLPCVEATEPELTIENYRKLCEYKDNALKVAEDTQYRLIDQLNKQVERYDNNMKYMAGIQTNAMNYTRAKEDAVLKVLAGLTELFKLDRMPIKPVMDEEGANNNGN